MSFLHEKVGREYERWRRKFGDEDPYASDDTIGIHEALRAHFLIVDYFLINEEYGIGGVGPRDQDLLHSAIYRQFISYGGKDKWDTDFEKCASLLYGLVQDHPFHDANKRTAFLVTLFYLTKLKRVPTLRQRELEDFIVEIADRKLDKYVRFRDLQKKGSDPEVLFIADFLRKNTREVDKRPYTVTFHELKGILKHHGFEMINASKNYIDIVRKEKHRSFFGLGAESVRDVRVLQVGFPGWKKQVGKGTIKVIREATGLTPEKGCDSKVFFKNSDPLNALIDMYSEPLRRLADR